MTNTHYLTLRIFNPVTFSVEGEETYNFHTGVTPKVIEASANFKQILRRLRVPNEPTKICFDCTRYKLLAPCNEDPQNLSGRACKEHQRKPDPKIIQVGGMSAVVVMVSRMPTSVERTHASGCLHSQNPDYILQGQKGLAKSVYFKRCDMKYRNIAGEEMRQSKK